METCGLLVDLSDPSDTTSSPAQRSLHTLQKSLESEDDPFDLLSRSQNKINSVPEASRETALPQSRPASPQSRPASPQPRPAPPQPRPAGSTGGRRSFYTLPRSLELEDDPFGLLTRSQSNNNNSVFDAGSEAGKSLLLLEEVNTGSLVQIDSSGSSTRQGGDF